MKKVVKFYESVTGAKPVEKFIRSLSPAEKAKVLAAFRFVQDTEDVPSTILCKMVNTDDLWEIRVKADRSIFRFLCFFDGGKLIIVAHGFQKKTQKTPQQEIKTANARKKDYLKRKK